MKKSNFFQALSIALFACATTLFVACEKDSTTAPSAAEAAQKDITVTDASGKNSVTLRVSSEQAELLEVMDWTKVLQVKPIFEAPTETFTEPSAAQPVGDNPLALDLELVSKNLEPGAKGVEITVRPEANEVAERWQWVYTLTTTYDNIRVRVNYGCHDVHYYRKMYSYSAFTWMASYYNRCTPNSWTQAWSIPSHQMRTQVQYNSGTSFTVTVW